MYMDTFLSAYIMIFTLTFNYLSSMSIAHTHNDLELSTQNNNSLTITNLAALIDIKIIYIL